MWEKEIRIYDTPGVHNNFSWDLTRLHYTELPGFESLVTYILSKWGLSQGAIMDYYGYLQVGKSCLLSFLTMWPFGFNVFTSTFCVFTFPSFFFFLFFIRSWFHVGHRSISGSHALCTEPTSTLNVHTLVWNGTASGSVHYSRDLQTSLFNNFFIKNGSHSTIHTFKNYFTIVFSVFSQITYI